MMTSETAKTILVHYLAELRNPATILSSQAITHYSQQAVALFFSSLKSDGESLREAIELLCEINALPNPKLSRIGLEALFPHLIERLNDSFEPELCKVYDRLFAQIISFCRQLPECHELNRTLTSFGLPNETSLLARKISLSNGIKSPLRDRPIKKILFLSRVTIGADVAITSVLMAGLKQYFPDAEIILIGPQKLTQLYAGDAHIRIHPIDYGRNNALSSRLNSWLSVANIVSNEVSTLSTKEFTVIDPDSRLTQLGLLPLLPPNVEKHCYFLFESRCFTHPGLEKLGQLSSQWLSEICDVANCYYPFISLSHSLVVIGREILRVLKSFGNQRIICLNFGVGGNSTKRLTEDFELELLLRLSEHNHLILDCGFSPEETEQSERLLTLLESHGKPVRRLNEQNYLDSLYQLDHNSIIAWQGGIGTFASIIAISDHYLGYDSSGQHLAAALSVPTLTFFVNAGLPVFAKRWHPFGLGKIQVIEINTSNNLINNQVISNILSRVELLLQEVY
jgi:ADP-heptose:LPS heptosyltransferase